MPRYGVFSKALAFPYRQKNNFQTYLYFLSFRSKKQDLFPVKTANYLQYVFSRTEFVTSSFSRLVRKKTEVSYVRFLLPPRVQESKKAVCGGRRKEEERKSLADDLSPHGRRRRRLRRPSDRPIAASRKLFSFE